MPESDVQITVHFTTDEPDQDKEFQKLLLATVDTDGTPTVPTGNSATLTETGLDTSGRVSSGSKTITGIDDTQRVPDDQTLVRVGSDLGMMATIDTDYRVRKVVHTVYDADDVTALSELTYQSINQPNPATDPWWKDRKSVV